jgi:hypothetical protein
VQRSRDLDSVTDGHVWKFKVASELKRSLRICLRLELPVLHDLPHACGQERVTLDDLGFLYPAVTRDCYFGEHCSRNARLPWPVVGIESLPERFGRR